jgi:hypothetical protein
MDLKILHNRGEQLPQLRSIEYRGSSATQVYRVDNTLKASAHLCYSLFGTFHVNTHSIHVALENGAGENIGSKVAIAALSTAKRHRDVQANGHLDDYPTFTGRRDRWLAAEAELWITLFETYPRMSGSYL